MSALRGNPKPSRVCRPADQLPKSMLASGEHGSYHPAVMP
jgi:hypothetical protein